MNRWTDDLQYYVFLSSISAMSGRWVGDNERLFAMEPCLPLKRYPPKAGLEHKSARSVDQRLTYCATGLVMIRGTSLQSSKVGILKHFVLPSLALQFKLY